MGGVAGVSHVTGLDEGEGMLIDWCGVLVMAANCLILEEKSERLSLSSRLVFVPLTVAEDVCGGASVDERIFYLGRHKGRREERHRAVSLSTWH